MDQDMMIVYGVSGALVLILLIKSIILVNEKTVFVIQRLGKFQRMAQAGLGFIVPFIDKKRA
ncbi:MAG: hypothetical protein IPG07_16450 [Crocinitomicaceae bacterium]|nr:hypothetical protein [Crocinitomicaceae bacterium]